MTDLGGIRICIGGNAIENFLSNLRSDARLEHIAQGGIERVPADGISDIVIIPLDLPPYRRLVLGLRIGEPLQKITELVDRSPGGNVARLSAGLGVASVARDLSSFCVMRTGGAVSVPPSVGANQPGFGGTPVRGCSAGFQSPNLIRTSSGSIPLRAASLGRSGICRWTAAIRARH